MKTPKMPAALPPDTTAADQAARVNAERAALADSKMRGRRSTIVGGALMAEDEQMARGTQNKARRATVSSLGM